MLTDEQLDERLYELMPRVETELLRRLALDSTPPHRFSWRFRVRMWLMLRRKTRRPTPAAPHNFKMQAKFVLVAIVVAALCAVTAFATIPAFRDMVSQVFQRYTEISFVPTQGIAPADVPFIPCAPEYIPSGFNLTNKFLDKESKANHLLYKDANKNTIHFSQDDIENFSMQINTEEVRLVTMEINGLEAYYYSNIGMQSVFWFDSNYCYYVSSNLDKETVIKIAESTKLQKY